MTPIRLVTLCALLSASVSLTWLWKGPTQPSRDMRPAAGSAAPRPMPFAALAPGQTLRYHMDYRNDGEADLTALLAHMTATPGDGPSVRRTTSLHVAGEWVLQGLEADDASITVFASLLPTSVRLLVDGKEAPDVGTVLRAALPRGVHVRLASDGHVTGFAPAPGVDAVTMSFWKEAFTASQWAAPREAPSPWRTQEESPKGRYEAQYDTDATLNQAACPAEAPSSQRKIRTRYVSMGSIFSGQSPMTGPQKGDIVVTGQGTACFSAQARAIARLDVAWDESRRENGIRVARDKTSLHVRLLPETASRRAVAASRAGTPRARSPVAWESASEIPSSPKEDRDAQDRRILGDGTWDSLRETLQDVDADPAKMDAIMARDLVLKLIALAHVEPSAHAAMAEAILSHKARSQTAVMAAHALGYADTPEAQATLLRVLDEASDRVPHAFLAVSALANVSHPSPALWDRLGRMSSSPETNDMLRMAASLGLGAIIMHVREHDPVEARRLLADAKASLLAQPGGFGSYVQVVKNAGAHEEADTLLDAYRANPDPAFRETLLMALRGLSSPRVDGWLRDVVNGDPDPHLRYQACQAVAERAPDGAWVSVLRAAYANEPSSYNRMCLVEAMGRHGQGHPDAAAFFRDTARTDATPDIRQRSSSWLARMNEGA